MFANRPTVRIGMMATLIEAPEMLQNLVIPNDFRSLVRVLHILVNERLTTLTRLLVVVVVIVVVVIVVIVNVIVIVVVVVLLLLSLVRASSECTCFEQSKCCWHWHCNCSCSIDSRYTVACSHSARVLRVFSPPTTCYFCLANDSGASCSAASSSSASTCALLFVTNAAGMTVCGVETTRTLARPL